MKFAFLAASALALSIPAFAQDGSTTPPAEPDTMQTQDGTMTDPATQTPPTNDPMTAPPAADPMTQDPAMRTPPATDPMTTPPATDPMAAQPAPGTPMQTAPGTPGGTMTQGGYAPAAPPMASAQPGGQVVFRPSAPVAQAFPPPPPKDEYPVCRGSVQDGCRNPGGQ